MNRLRAATLATLLVAGCTTPAPRPDPESGPPQRPGQTFVFECGADSTEALSFVMRTGPGETALWLPPRFGRPYLVLGQTRAASGARYEGDGVVLWTKGRGARLEVDGEALPACLENRRRSIWEHAKLSGVDFRATGNEPGWHLELRRGERMRFVYDYGQRQAVTPMPEPLTDQAARRTVYHAVTEADDLTVTLEGEPCSDDMSGEAFETTVTVLLNGTTYRGCGRALH